MTEQEIEIRFLRTYTLELLDENDHLKSQLKKARKAKKRFKRKYLKLRALVNDDNL